MNDLGIKSKILKGQVTTVELRNLVPAKYNPRKISKPNMENLKKSIETLGYFDPIIVNKDFTIISGHQRVAAMQELGYEVGEVLQIDVDKETEKKINLAANSQGLSGEWDSIPLSELLQTLALTENDLAAIGFTQAEVDRWTRTADAKQKYDGVGKRTTDDVPDTDSLTKAGDILAIGNHRLGCLDATDPLTYTAMLGERKIDLVVTSPPYFNARKYSQWPDRQSYSNFLAQVAANLFQHMADISVVAWNVGLIRDFDLPALSSTILEAAGFTYVDTLFWYKREVDEAYINSGNPCFKHIGKSRRYYPSCPVEVILIFKKGEGFPQFDEADIQYAKQYISSSWVLRNVKPGKDRHLQSAPYPVELAERLIRLYSQSGDLVVDPFVGSGTTIVAAHLCSRTGYGWEIQPQYCDFALARIQSVTAGGVDGHDGSGDTANGEQEEA